MNEHRTETTERSIRGSGVGEVHHESCEWGINDQVRWDIDHSFRDETVVVIEGGVSEFGIAS